MPPELATPPAARVRISRTSKYLMLATAAFFDTLQGIFSLFLFVPFVGIVVIPLNWMFNTASYMTFYIWFKMHSVQFAGNIRKGGWFFGSLMLEALPISGALPWLTIGVWRIIRATEKEDAEATKKIRSEWRDRVAAFQAQ
jgi:hypothetical protein